MEFPWRSVARKVRIIWKIKPYTMLSHGRLSSLYDFSQEIERNGIAGCVVECGVWNGGSAAMLGGGFQYLRGGRNLWLFDSFAGLPEPTDDDVSITGKKGKAGAALGSEILVREVCLDVMRLPPSRVHVVKGWFQDVMPTTLSQMDDIALLHLDCDWYASVMYCLDTLYDKVARGGVIVVDDYGYFQGCKKAVDEFLQKRHIPANIIKTAESAVYFHKI